VSINKVAESWELGAEEALKAYFVTMFKKP